MTPSALVLRAATPADIPAIRQLHAASLRRLGRGHYSPATLERVLRSGSFQPELLRQGRYKLALLGDQLVGSGGWLEHATANSAMPLGPDTSAQRRRDTACVRAVYVAPWLARQGIGSALLDAIEAEMLALGKRRARLVATRMAVRFFNRHGYAIEHPLTVAVAGGRLVEVLAMRKTLRAPGACARLGRPGERGADECVRAALCSAA